MKIRRIALSLLLVFAISSSTFAVTLPEVSGFDDMTWEDENYEAVDYLRGEAIVEGYSDGTYRPDFFINRAEFLKIVLESVDDPEANYEGSDCYPDVKDDWYAKYVCAATKSGFVKGYPDGKFRPEKMVNFAEASKIVTNVLGLKKGENWENWYEEFVVALEEEKAIPQSIDSFDKAVTRGEMAEMVWRVREDPYVSFTNYYGIKRKEKVSAFGTGELIPFESCTDLTAHLEEASSIDADDYYLAEGVAVMLVVPTDSAADTGETSAGSDSTSSFSAAKSESSGDYSTTNVQVAGVDEADIVKTDGEYIYFLNGATVRIVKAYPADSMVELDKLTFENDSFTPMDMYVDGDRLVVLGNSYAAIDTYASISIPADAPYYTGSLALVYVFDVTDPADIKLFRKEVFEGYYSDSRKVGDTVYVVINEYTNYYFDAYYNSVEVMPVNEIVPGFVDDGVVEPVAPCADVLWVPGVESTDYLILAAVPVDDANAEVDREVVLGGNGEVYASLENLYVAEHDFSWCWWGGCGDEDEKTVIHKFSLGEDVGYVGSGEAPGTVLNQFSMDEHEGYFRVATTRGDLWDSVNPSTNNLYILDADLKLAGSVEGIAPGEQIHSVRFMGDRAYIVTFKKIDPFFVLDVSNPTAPKILGKLKIPGYSDYLHPFDENHIIGFGKDTADPSEEEAGSRDISFAWYQGLKLAMFDVTDVTDPKELHKEIIGDRGTDSELLYNHKALLFDKNKGIFAFPVTLAELPQSVKDDPNASGSEYGDYVYQGAYVYDVSIENGFQLRGRITHYDENEIAEKSGYYWGGIKDVKRILYIGDAFYTVSQAIVQANAMDDFGLLNALKLADVQETYPPYGIEF